MKGEDRAKDPAPAGDFNHDEFPTDDPFVCERCGDPLGHGYRFCSRACFEEWRQEGPLPEMTFEEMQAEMRAVFDRLASYSEEETS